MEKVSLSIDGKRVDCAAGTSLLRAAEAHEIRIPTLCDHPDLKPFGACRLCLVEDEKTGRLLASCVTPAVQDMVIRTDSARIKQHRRNIVRLMMAEHPESCLVCSQGNRCRLRQLAADLGLGETGLYPMPNFKPFEQANPFIVRDLSKCVLCAKCIRADHELVVVGAIDYSQRGFPSRPVTLHELPLEHSTCTFCGTCVSICPTGALIAKNPPGDPASVGTPAREALSVCGFCGVGCALAMGAADNRIVEVNPAHRQQSVNKSTLCVKGHFAHDYLNTRGRLTQPLIRKKGQLSPAAWEEALALIASRLLEIKQAGGPQSIAFLGSSKCTNEENYLFQKIARAFLGTSHVDNAGSLGAAPLLRRWDELTDGGCRVNRLDQIETAEAILVLGADPTHSAPVLGYYLKRAAKKGIPLIVVDPRQTELADFSSAWLAIKPQTDLAFINGLTALLCEKDGHDPEFIQRCTEGFPELRSELEAIDLEDTCRVTGLERSRLEETAERLKGKKIAMVVGNGIMQQKHGMHAVEALFNLALMTAGIGSSGSGVYMLVKENNQIGAMDMGMTPDLLPGRRPLSDQAIRAQWAQSWQRELPSHAGLGIAGMIEAAESGGLKALYIMGENPLRMLPQQRRVKKALEKLDLVVAQDILNNETTAVADVVLPGAAFCEKAGSFTNLEGRIQSFSAVVAPPADARPDWEILDLLAAKMDGCQPYGALENLQAEIRRLVPMYADLKAEGHGWVKPSSAEGIVDTTAASSLLSFAKMVSPQDEAVDDAYPFTAILGSVRFHLGSGTRSSRSERIAAFGLNGEMEISPEDADQLDLSDGDKVKIVSRHGAVQRQIRREGRVGPGRLFLPLAVCDNDAVNLIGLSAPAAPEYSGLKTCSVRIEKL